jgi:hypothetical protein
MASKIIDFDEVKRLKWDYFEQGSPEWNFTKNANINWDKGITEIPVGYLECLEIDPELKLGNGATWNRERTSPLGKVFDINNKKGVMKVPGAKRKSHRTVAIELTGYAINRYDTSIPDWIYDHYSGKPCVILNTTSDVELDHKNGRKDHYLDGETELDFQPLHRVANHVKREYCKKCRNNGIRFDAKVLGYLVSYVIGGENYQNCNGCYWYDPQEFNRYISKDFFERKQIEMKQIMNKGV